MAFRILEKPPGLKPGACFISVYKPIAGWKAIMYIAIEDHSDDGGGCYWDVQQTGFFGYDTKAEAQREAKHWAESEEEEYYPD